MSLTQDQLFVLHSQTIARFLTQIVFIGLCNRHNNAGYRQYNIRLRPALRRHTEPHRSKSRYQVYSHSTRHFSTIRRRSENLDCDISGENTGLFRQNLLSTHFIHPFNHHGWREHLCYGSVAWLLYPYPKGVGSGYPWGLHVGNSPGRWRESCYR